MKSRSSIFKNNKIILRYIGILTIIIGIIVLLPLIVIIAYPNESKYSIDFIIPSIIAISIGFMLSYFIKLDKNQKLSMGQDTIIVVIVWILASFFFCNSIYNI